MVCLVVRGDHFPGSTFRRGRIALFRTTHLRAEDKYARRQDGNNIGQ